ncbi:hypothetical protein DFS34DRAFT_368845 [Phlyctochytrium arcticum]|nr:hypothetical protein DFS34DRAFT_368845 [Phlyctochytrium arcticum]
MHSSDLTIPDVSFALEERLPPAEDGRWRKVAKFVGKNLDSFVNLKSCSCPADHRVTIDLNRPAEAIITAFSKQATTVEIANTGIPVLVAARLFISAWARVNDNVPTCLSLTGRASNLPGSIRHRVVLHFPSRDRCADFIKTTTRSPSFGAYCFFFGTSPWMSAIPPKTPLAVQPAVCSGPAERFSQLLQHYPDVDQSKVLLGISTFQLLGKELLERIIQDMEGIDR